MTRSLILFVCIAFLVSCNSNEGETKEELIVYKPSEMALLMRQMYAYNKAIRTTVIEKDSIVALPDHFLKIHQAKLTDPEDRDARFEQLSKKYLQMQQSIQKDNDSAKFFYNSTINSCISCHELKCQGPIPKIRRLLIQ